MADGFTELQRNALCLVQALLGAVSSNFRLVSISQRANGIVVQIVLATHSDEDIEEIDDLITEYEALQSCPEPFEFEWTVSEEPITLEPPNASTIVVVRRRE